jgi:CheY-like chemotaxis protein
MAGMNTDTLLMASQLKPNELLQKFQENFEGPQTGHWELRLHSESSSLYLAIVRNKVVFAGSQPLCWPALRQGLQRYVPQLRTLKAREAIAALEESDAINSEILGKLLGRIEQLTEVSRQTLNEAVQTQIQVVCDQFWDGVTEVSFIPEPSVFMQSPIDGIAFESLAAQMQVRHQEWQRLKIFIPSMEAIPILNAAALEKATLSPVQKQQIEKLASFGRPLSIISQMTAKDPLTTAKTFANLVRGGLVSLKLPADLLLTEASKPEIVIVDDSIVFLQQFQSLVSSWGYRVTVCSTTATAIETMIAVQPDLIFLDINMPGMSGFDLIKAVRREAQLTDKNLVLLTAENSISNQWRAKWGNCKFLAKPRTPEEIKTFQSDLKQLIQEMIPVAQ